MNYEEYLHKKAASEAEALAQSGASLVDHRPGGWRRAPHGSASTVRPAPPPPNQNQAKTRTAGAWRTSAAVMRAGPRKKKKRRAKSVGEHAGGNERKEKEIAELEAAMTMDGFFEDFKHVRRTTARHAELKSQLQSLSAMGAAGVWHLWPAPVPAIRGAWIPRWCLLWLLFGEAEAGFVSAQELDAESKSALLVSPSLYDFSKNPKLLKRIRSGAHGYFRFINVPFSEHVCRLFDADVRNVPRTNLHGDAHLEQYAVTELGRGLTDFDDSSTGPFVLDLVRFGVSVRLACREHGWLEQCDDVFREFLRGYRAALANPRPKLRNQLWCKHTVRNSRHSTNITSSGFLP